MEDKFAEETFAIALDGLNDREQAELMVMLERIRMNLIRKGIGEARQAPAHG